MITKFNRTALAGLTATVLMTAASLAQTISSVSRPPTDGGSTLYVSNRAPLAPSPLIKLPIGSIAPHGWLHHQLQLQADGMCGHLEEISPWCKFEGNAWTDPKGAGRNGWEEVPYWIKGFGDLGYVLKDQRITDDAKRWLDAIFAAQAEDGWFGPSGLRTSLKGKPDLWPHMPVLNAMQSYYEYSGDPRVITLMTRYFKWELQCPESEMFTGYWDKLRTGDNLESVYWLYNRTGDKSLLELAEKLHRRAANWVGGMPNWHNVNISEGFREPAEYGMQACDPKFYAATTHDYDIVMDRYGQFPGGGFGGDENCRPGYYDPRQGFETCGIVEFMHSFELLTRISGSPIWADRCEEIAFNSLPAALTPDLKALHYLTAANQIQLDKNNKAPGINNSGTMFSYSPDGVYRCCQHNHGMGWPYFAEELWHATSDRGLCASLYAPCTVTAKVGEGTIVKIDETTPYPFGDTFALFIATPHAVKFPLYLRVPGWCQQKPIVKINKGEEQPINSAPPSFVVIDRTWADGDIVLLRLPMQVVVKTWRKNKDAVSVAYGPLEFSLDIGQKWVKYGGSDKWPEQEVYPTTPWNYGLVLDANEPEKSFTLESKSAPVPDQPFTPDGTPIHIKAKAKRISDWTADHNELIRPLMVSPILSDQPTEDITLIPMGSARLRISAFPVIGAGPDAHPWSQRSGLAAQAKPSASHVFEGDTLDALNDGLVPANSSDETIPRFTWWNHKGTSEWVQYEFKQPTKISSMDVYWFDDTGHGECRVPRNWRVVYRDGTTWKAVEGNPTYGTARDKFNHADFTSVETTAVRLEVELQGKVSGGILEWVVK